MNIRIQTRPGQLHMELGSEDYHCQGRGVEMSLEMMELPVIMQI